VFSQFGIVVSTKIMRDPDTGKSKQYGFVCFDNFESSDNAIAQMKGQFLGGKPVDVSYSFKKEGGMGASERHGGVAERVIA
jgi:splicing factor 3B subunit 4